MRASRALETHVQPVVAGLLALVTLIGLIGPAIKNPSPHDIPVGLVGVAAATNQIAGAFAANAPGAFRFTDYSSEADARAAMDARAVDGALVVGPGGPRLIVAGAAGDGSTGVITAAFTKVFQAQGQILQVETVHPFAAGDPHGLILFFVVLAVIVSTLIGLIGPAIKNPSPHDIPVGLVGVAAATNQIAGAFAANAPGAFRFTDYSSEADARAAMDARAVDGALVVGPGGPRLIVAGAAALLGRPGIALAALVAVLLDLISSGGPIGSRLLPDAYRFLAPAMPAGELYSGMRGALYFDNGGTGEAVLVLTAWVVGGAVLLLLGGFVHRAANR
ncbi:MAG: hypothetical protein E6I72_04635 [Chloroflexi bacterium]|nr:MAG: hypothetical protein E6I72_04635 [Chloroflexota bacterium]